MSAKLKEKFVKEIQKKNVFSKMQKVKVGPLGVSYNP